MNTGYAVICAFAVGACMYGVTYLWPHYFFKKEETLQKIVEKIRRKRKKIEFSNSCKVEDALKKSLHEYAFHSLELEGEATDQEAIARIKRASEYAEKNLKIGSITITHIRGIHGNLFKEEKPYMAGLLRNQEVEVGGIDGASYKPPPYDEVENRLKQLVDWLNDQTMVDQTKLVTVAAKAKIEFLLIHPFLDGNGRTSRAIFNGLLRGVGYPWVVLPSTEKYQYFKSINIMEKENDMEPFLRYMAVSVERSLDNFIKDIAE